MTTVNKPSLELTDVLRAPYRIRIRNHAIKDRKSNSVQEDVHITSLFVQSKILRAIP